MTKRLPLAACLLLASPGLCQTPEKTKSLGDKILTAAANIIAAPFALLGASCEPQITGVTVPGPVDMTLQQFEALSPVERFELKHRRQLPPSYQPVDAAQFLNGAYHVGIGVALEGAVSEVDFNPDDGDVSFRVSGVECEITPEDQLAGVPRPAVGQKVRVYGWSYYDDLDGPSAAQWEVHPVKKIEAASP